MSKTIEVDKKLFIDILNNIKEDYEEYFEIGYGNGEYEHYCRYCDIDTRSDEDHEDSCFLKRIEPYEYLLENNE